MLEPAAPLLAPLRRIRRRLRFWRALDGSVAGLAVGLAAAALVTGVLHHRGQAAGSSLPFLLAVGSAAAGALTRVAGRIPLAHCARRADAALDGQDRVLSALDFADGQRPIDSSPLAQASIADATARLAELVPARAVPPRQPPGLPALAAGAAVAVLAGLSTVRSPAVASQSFVQRRPAGTRLAPGALETEREAVHAIARDAARRQDARAAALAAQLERTLAHLEAGALDGGAALDALRAVAMQAAEAAGAGERERTAFEAAAEALASRSSTRQAAEALRAGGEAVAQKTAAALGRGAETRPTETAGALTAAARAMASGGDGAEPAAKPGRRLARNGRETRASGPENGGPEREAERRLERLSRDLDEAAGACRDGSPSCRSSAESRGRELAGLGQRAAEAEAMRQLERAAGQARARLGRGELGEAEAGVGEGERRFQRAARGDGESPGDHRQAPDGAQQDRSPTVAGQTGAPGESPSSGGRGSASEPGQTRRRAGGEGNEAGGEVASGEPALVERPGASAGSAAGGEGAGREAGGPPLGPAEGPGNWGRETEAHVSDGAGPSRAQVIGVAAGRGFAAPGYARVFADYEGAVEDALASTAVPEGKRYLVRRYFDLIRPRAGGVRR